MPRKHQAFQLRVKHIAVDVQTLKKDDLLRNLKVRAHAEINEDLREIRLYLLLIKPIHVKSIMLNLIRPNPFPDSCPISLIPDIENELELLIKHLDALHCL